MTLKQIGEQVDGVLPCCLVVTVDEDAEQQLQYLVDVPRIEQLFTQTTRTGHRRRHSLLLFSYDLKTRGLPA